MKKTEKKFMVVFVKESNCYGLAFTSNGEWLAERIWMVDDPKKADCLISESILWKVGELHQYGYDFVGMARVEKDEDFWNIDATIKDVRISR